MASLKTQALLAKIDRAGSKPFNEKPPGLVYHYTKEAGFRGILESRTVWATHFQALEDTSELRHVEAHIRSTAHRLRRSTYRGSTFVGQTLDEFIQDIPKFAVADFGKVYVCVTSFCLEPDDPNMWCRFADRGAGYCLGMKALQTERAAVPGLAGSMNSVVYNLDSQRDKFRRIARKVLDQVDLCDPADEAPMRISALTELNSAAASISCLSKAPRYKAEREWRLLIMVDDLELVVPEPRPHVAWPLRAQATDLPALETLHFGPRCPADAELCAKEFLRSLGYGDVEKMPSLIRSTADLSHVDNCVGMTNAAQ